MLHYSVIILCSSYQPHHIHHLITETEAYVYAKQVGNIDNSRGYTIVQATMDTGFHLRLIQN